MIHPLCLGCLLIFCFSIFVYVLFILFHLYCFRFNSSSLSGLLVDFMFLHLCLSHVTFFFFSISSFCLFFVYLPFFLVHPFSRLFVLFIYFFHCLFFSLVCLPFYIFFFYHIFLSMTKLHLSSLSLSRSVLWLSLLLAQPFLQPVIFCTTNQ